MRRGRYTWGRDVRESPLYSIGRRRGEGRLGRFLGGGLLSQLLPACYVPFVDILIRLGRECLCGYVGWEWHACLEVLEMPVLDRQLYEGYMLLRHEQYLYGLPANEALEGQRRDSRRGKVIVGGL